MQTNINWAFVISVILYVIIIAFFAMAVYYESKDINCSRIRNGVCGYGCGTAYYDGKYEPGDTKDEILEKLQHTARYEFNSITWRRSYIISVISGFLSILYLRNKIPTGIELAGSFMIIYAIIYMSFILFERWLVKPAIEQFDELIEKLK